MPLLVRALRVENLLLRLAPNLDSTGYYSVVERNVSARNDSPSRALAVGLGVGLSALVSGGVVWASTMKSNTQKN